ncbi:MAG: radical SAM protein [Thermodesulfobacteriota bacterium]
MEVLLVEPPQADPAQPYSSLAVLLAAWRRAGLKAAVADLNVDFFNYLCQTETIEASLKAAERRLAAARFRDENEEAVLRQAAAWGGQLAPAVLKALGILRDPALFYDPGAYAWAIRLLQKALAAVSAPYYPGQISLQSFKTAHSYLSSGGILAAAQDEAANIFLHYCEDAVRPRLAAHRPDVLAVSVTFQTQMIPAWTLAARAKQWFPEMKVVFGGATITRIQEGLRQAPQLFQNVDACILFEGETAFPALLQAWEQGKAGTDAPNVMEVQGGAVVTSAHLHTEDLNLLPPPDHGGLALDSYWWPQPALLINSSRGCYYGKCAFCAISPATWGPERRGRAYRQRSPEKIVADLVFVHRQTGVQTFNLANDSLPPRALAEIGAAIRQQGLPFIWDSEVRLDRGLTRKVLQNLAAGGCRHLRFGFETASPRVAQLMHKGLDLSTTRRIITDCRDVGITVSLMCQIGFPGETLDEAVDTLVFLRDNRDRVPFVSLAQFTLEQGAKIFQHPRRYGVMIHPLPPDEDLSWMYRYTREDGIDSDQTGIFFEEVESALDRNYPDRDLFFKGGLGHAHTSLYTRRYSPEEFISWNQRPHRRAGPLEETAALRSAKGLMIRPVGPISPKDWTRLIISSLEVPELSAAADGSILLLLLAALEPTPVKVLIDWVQYLSGNGYSASEAGEVLNFLYEAGLLLAAAGDARAVALW